MTVLTSPFCGKRITPALAVALVLSALCACQTGPSDPFGEAQRALAEGEPRTASVQIDAALAMRPDDLAVQQLAGDIAMAMGNADRAVTFYSRALEGAPHDALTRAKRAEANLMAGNMGAAREDVAGLIYDVPLAFSVAVGFALAQGDSAQASEKLEAGLERFAKDPRLVTIDAQRLFDRADAAAAMQRLAPVLALKPALSHAHRLAGQMALARRDLAEAERHFTQVLQLRPNDQTAMLAMAALARDTGDEIAAANWIDRANKAGPPHPVGLLFATQINADMVVTS